MKRHFEIDPTLAAVMPSLTDEELAVLRGQIQKSGYVQPLVVLVLADTGRRVLGDGHNRLAIAEELKISYVTRDVEVADLGEAIEWIILEQSGRRNLTPEAKAYLRGKDYLNAKKPHGGSIPQSEGSNGETAEKVAKKHKVSRATVERDAKYTEGVDALPPEAKARVLSGKAGATKAEVATGVFCRRCIRTGMPVKNCPACKEAREKAEARAAKKKAAKPPKPKKIAMGQFNRALGQISRFLLAQADKSTGQEFVVKFSKLGTEVAEWLKKQAT